ncbi:MAG: stage II sporulation protein P [Monoglobaceae bacterium]
MRKYKAVVIDLKGMRRTAVLTALTGIVAAGVIYASGRWILPSAGFGNRVIENVSPIVETATDTEKIADKVKSAAELAARLIFGFVPWSGDSVIESSSAVYGAAEEGGFIAVADNKTVPLQSGAADAAKVQKSIAKATDIPEERRAPIKSIDAAQKQPNSIGNETSYSIDVNAALAAKPDIDMSRQGPKILITHTHATEAYDPSGAEYYDTAASDRSINTDENVVAAGEAMAEIFSQRGIEVVHDTVLHDEPSFNGSYAHSLATVQEYIKKYPSIQIVFDVHRDSIVYDDKTKAKTVTEINGKPAAQLMFVVGTDEKGLYNPDWRENMTAALHFQKTISERYPTLMRHINLRRERFNGHTTHASMIIETGTSGNSLDEAIYSISLAAECIADYLNTL